MLRLLTFALAMLLCFCARADYRILSLNTPSIEIGGKRLKVNDTFAPGANIRWKAPLHAMKVRDTATGEVHVLVGREEGKKSEAADRARTLTKSMTASLAPTTPMRALKEKLSRHFYILGSLELKTGMSTDANHYFFISYFVGDHEYTKPVENKDGTITLTSDTFATRGITPRDELRVKVYYYNKIANRVIPVCDKMRVTVLPDRIP